MVSGWSLQIRWQSGVFLDWYGLADPFRVWLPLQFTNPYPNAIYVQGNLSGGSSQFTIRYTEYSGNQLGNIGGDGNGTLRTIFSFSSSGATSPYYETFHLGLIAYSGSNYSGVVATGLVTFSGILFNRDSHIKVFGDDYNNNYAPQPTVSGTSGGTFASGARPWWCISYVKSGWESDVSTPTPWESGMNAGIENLGENPVSGLRYNLSWSSIEGATQYFVWRWSGIGTVGPGATEDNRTLYQSGKTLNIMDLIYASNQTTLVDNNLTPLTSNHFRHGRWSRRGTGRDDLGGVDSGATAPYLSSGTSRQLIISDAASTFMMVWAHAYALNRNVSGNLSGPYFLVLHRFNPDEESLRLNDAIDGSSVGTYLSPIANYLGTSGAQNLNSGWSRDVLQIPRSNQSGYVHIQLHNEGAYGGDYVDDVFVVAFS